MRRFAYMTLWMYVFTIPWEHSTDIGTGIGSVTRVVGIAAMFAGMTAVAMRGSMRRVTIFHGTVVAFYLLVLASYFWTVDADATAKAIRAFPQEIWIVWLIWEFAPDAIHRSALMFAFVAGGYVTAFLTIWDYAASTIVTRGEIRFSPDGWNPNEVAILMAIGIPMAAMLACRPQRLFVRSVALGYLGLGPLTAVLTASRGGVVAMTISLISVPVILGGRRTFRRVATLVLLAVIAAGIFVIAPRNSWNRMATFGVEITEGNLNDRLPIWQAGLRTFEASASNTIIGVGADGFIPAVGLAYAAHNTYLSILVDFGLAGFAVFSFLLFQVMNASLHAANPERLALVFCLACWIVAVAGGIWEHLRPTWFLFGVIASAGLSANTQLGFFRTLRIERIRLTV